MEKDAGFISVTIECPELGREVTSSSVYIGGNWCMGHGPDEYCYCDTDRWLEVTCDHGVDAKGRPITPTHKVRVY